MYIVTGGCKLLHLLPVCKGSKMNPCVLVTPGDVYTIFLQGSCVSMREDLLVYMKATLALTQLFFLLNI